MRDQPGRRIGGTTFDLQFDKCSNLFCHSFPWLIILFYLCETQLHRSLAPEYLHRYREFLALVVDGLNGTLEA